MTLVVAATALLALTGFFGAALQGLRALVREHARERQLMLNQILHLAGRTWTPPPVEEWQPTPEDEEQDRYLTSVSDTPAEF